MVARVFARPEEARAATHERVASPAAPQSFGSDLHSDFESSAHDTHTHLMGRAATTTTTMEPLAAHLEWSAHLARLGSARAIACGPTRCGLHLARRSAECARRPRELMIFRRRPNSTSSGRGDNIVERREPYRAAGYKSYSSRPARGVRAALLGAPRSGATE